MYIKTLALRCALAFVTSASLVGCAADDADETPESESENESAAIPSQVAENPQNAAADSAEESEVIEKGLRNDYCCVFKTDEFEGQRVGLCQQYYRTKVAAKTLCFSRGAGWAGSVLRDGSCNRYSDCVGNW